jgi:hypothetical protein
MVATILTVHPAEGDVATFGVVLDPRQVLRGLALAQVGWGLTIREQHQAIDASPPVRVLGAGHH